VRVYRGSCIGDFNTCKKKCYYRWFHDPPLEPIEPSANLRIGDLTHQAAHLWYQHLELPTEDKLELINKHLDEQQATDPHENRPEWVAEAKRLITALATAYPTETFRVVSPEMTMVVQLLEGVDLCLQLTVDGIIELQTDLRPERPMLVLEHKTASQRTGPVITGYLRSPQIISYTWACRERAGFPVIGGLYNLLVKTKLAEVVRQTTSIGKPLQQRWFKSFLMAAADLEDCKERDSWRENLASCHTLFGECPYLPLCTHYTSTSLKLFREAREDAVREQLLVRYAPNGAELITQKIEGV